MKIFYRISDNSYSKIKLPGTCKKFCLQNFLQVFPADAMTINADNCLLETHQWISSLAPEAELITSNLSNAGSFVLSLQKAMMLPEDETIYFVEDDYLHHGTDLSQTIDDGLSCFDYVTLFDHPDKYQSEYNFGEVCVVRRIQHKYWRTTLSTCMTFATKVKTLKRDFATWLKYTQGTHPHDHLIFVELDLKGSSLGVCLPGQAFHTDLTYQFSKCMVDELIDPWVLQLLQSVLLGDRPDTYPDVTGFKKLILLDAINKKSPG